METVKRKVRNVDDFGKITYKTIEKEIVSKKEAIIKDAKSSLFLTNLIWLILFIQPFLELV